MQFGDTLDNMVDGRRKNLRETEYRRIVCACIISANKHFHYDTTSTSSDENCQWHNVCKIEVNWRTTSRIASC